MWTLNDLASGIMVALVAVWAITIVALIVHGRRDAVRFFTARATWIAFGKIILLIGGFFVGIFVVVMVIANMPWPTIGFFLVALLTSILMAFQAVWDWFKDRSLTEQLVIIAIVMTWVIVGTIRSAADRITRAMNRSR
jgi:hypothetical protein